MQHHHYRPVDELREGSRFEKDEQCDFAALHFPDGEHQLVEVHDESLGGLSLLLDKLGDLQLGSRLDIIYAGGYQSAIVQHIEPQCDGRYLVGFECKALPLRKGL